MRHLRKILIIGCLSLWLLTPADGAISVITVPGSQTTDWTNLIQTTATAVQTYDMLQRMIRDMMPFDAFPVDGLQTETDEILTLLRALSGLIPFAEGAAERFDVLYPASIDLLCHPDALHEWRLQAVEQTRLAYRDSVEAQRLVARLGEILRRVLGVVNQTLAIGGKVEGLQTASQNGSLALAEQARLTTILTVMSRATSSQEAYAVTERRAQECIHAVALESRERRVPFAVGGGLQ